MPTVAPSPVPTTQMPSDEPSTLPTTLEPTSNTPTTRRPTQVPSTTPTLFPTTEPSSRPTSASPSSLPTISPTASPSALPTLGCDDVVPCTDDGVDDGVLFCFQNTTDIGSVDSEYVQICVPVRYDNVIEHNFTFPGASNNSNSRRLISYKRHWK